MHGAFCNLTCGQCSDVACGQNNSICLSDCLDGYYTDFCNEPCNYNGCQTCDRSTGDCLTCKQGLWGSNCDNACSSSCQPSGDGLIYCNKSTGVCQIGACLPGYYSTDCTLECNSNCGLNASGILACRFEDGRCLFDCKNGFYEDQCNSTCSSNCADPLNCERDGECNITTGCVENFYGFDCTTNCTSTCNDDTCDRNDGICEECRKVPSQRSPLCRDAGEFLLKA